MIIVIYILLQFISLNFLIFMNSKLVIYYNIRLKLISKLEGKKVKVFINLEVDEIIINLNLID